MNEHEAEILARAIEDLVERKVQQMEDRGTPRKTSNLTEARKGLINVLCNIPVIRPV